MITLLLAILSVWDYPARFPMHEQLRNQFVVALRSGDTTTMEETCRKGVELLPDDPTWHYNLACSLAYFPKRATEALDELEKAIDLGFRKPDEIAADTDLNRLKNEPRYHQLIEYAREMKTRPLLFGPLATVDATGVFGTTQALGEQNLVWDFDRGLFDARLKLAIGAMLPWTGDLYMNRDGGHSPIDVKRYPGLTEVKFDSEGRRRGLDLNAPNVCFPYPTFGNSSRAFMGNPYWRSIPRALMTTQARDLKAMEKLYLSNQFWVFPSNADTAPVGTNGDVFASIAPYWLTTAGRSYSDRPYVHAALLASAALKADVKREIVRRRLLTPTIQTLIRKSLSTVRSEADYLSYKAHPTAFPPNGVDTNRLVAAAAKLTISEIPPLAVVTAELVPAVIPPVWPELTYRSAFAWAYVLRADDEKRIFFIRVDPRSAEEFTFVQTHGLDVDVTIERVRPNEARVTVDRKKMSPTTRVDIAVFARNKGTGWGAPSYVSIARMDPSAPYSDPALTPLAQPEIPKTK